MKFVLILLLNSSAASMFWIGSDGKVALAQLMTEESDGPLSMGLLGGGKTGWSPWNHKFLGIVENVESGKLEEVVDVNQKVMAPPPEAEHMLGIHRFREQKPSNLIKKCSSVFLSI